MSIVYKGQGFQLTRFFGGADRGVCFQLTVGEVSVELTMDQANELVEPLLNFLDKSLATGCPKCGGTHRHSQTDIHEAWDRVRRVEEEEFRLIEEGVTRENFERLKVRNAALEIALADSIKERVEVEVKLLKLEREWWNG